MKIEQACRFRANDGYRLVAQSSGVGHTEEHALELFSDVMGGLLGEPSSKAVSCLMRGNVVVTAQATGLSDAYGRRAVFAHGVFIKRPDYVEALENDPLGTLAWLYAKACSSTNTTGDLPVLEYDEETPTVCCRDVRERAGLDDDTTYAAYLKEVVRAILFGGAVCLDDMQGDSERLLPRVACAAYGLPKRLQLALTWSSAFDTRAAICVAGAERVGTGRLTHFSAQDYSQDVMAGSIQDETGPFMAVAQMGDEGRRAYLDRVDGWMSSVLPGVSLPNMQILLCAMCLARCEELDGAEKTRLLEMLLGLLAEPAVETDVIERTLVDVLQATGEREVLPTELLGRLARYATQHPRPELTDAVLARVDSGDSDACRAVLASLLEQARSSSDAQPIVVRLIERLGKEDSCAGGGSASLFADQELGEKALLWYARRNDSNEEAALCSAYVNNRPLDGLNALLAGVLHVSQGQRLTSCEAVLVGGTLHRLLTECDAAQVEPLPAEVREDLFARFDELPEQAQADCVAYYFRVVLHPGNATREERLASMESRIANQSSSQFDYVIARTLNQCGCETDQSLWEEHCAGHVQAMRTAVDLKGLCDEVNRFKNPDGPFEKAVAQALVPMLGHINENGFEANAQLNHSDRLYGSRRFIQGLNVSEPTKQGLDQEFVIRYLRAVPLREFTQEDSLLNTVLLLPELNDAEVEMRRRFAWAWNRLCKDQYDMGPLEHIISSDPLFTESAIQEVIGSIPSMLDNLAEKGHFSWDLAFIAFIGKDKRGRSVLNAEGLVRMLAGLDDYRSLRIEPSERVPSHANSARFGVVEENAKAVKKAARNCTSRYVHLLLSGLDSPKEKKNARTPAAHNMSVAPVPSVPTAPAHMDGSPYSKPPKGPGLRGLFGKR